MTIPTIRTDRTILRPFARTDFDTYAAFLASPRAVHMDGPLDTDKSWTWFTNDIASWHLYGFGTLAVDVDGVFAGCVGLVHPPHFPEPECGWFLFDDYEGQGLATEAARAMIDHTFATTDLASIVSYIGNSNAASASVAARLGATRDAAAARPDAGCDVWRHRRTA